MSGSSWTSSMMGGTVTSLGKPMDVRCHLVCDGWHGHVISKWTHDQITSLSRVTTTHSPSVKTSSTPRGNSESQSDLMTFRTWLHCVWCALASIVLSVLKLVGGLEKVRGAQLSWKANQ